MADELNPSARTPTGQGTDVPLGWKPTLKQPVPVTRCTIIKADGERCEQWSMRGMVKCYAHGKRELRFPSVQAQRDAVIEAARLRLLDLAPEAVEVLKQLTLPGTAEGIRLKAATEVLDRAGIRGGFEVDVEVQDKTDPSRIIAEKLAKLREAAGVIEGEVIDVEEVPDPEDGQLTLFDEDE